MNPEIKEAIKKYMVNEEVKQLCADTPQADLPDVISNYFGCSEIFDSDPKNIRPDVTITHSRSGGIHITLARTQPDGKTDKQKEYLTWLDFVAIALDDSTPIADIIPAENTRLLNAVQRMGIENTDQLKEAAQDGRLNVITGTMYSQLVRCSEEHGIKLPKRDIDHLQQARELSQRIQVAAEMAQVNLWDMCTGLKEMRDTKLYKQLGYTNFESYCEEIHGFSRKQAHQYIAVAEKYSSEKNVTSRLQNAQLGISKLYLLSTLDEEQREQLAESTDLESATVKELEAEISKLKHLTSCLNEDYNKALTEKSEAAKEHQAEIKKLAADRDKQINELKKNQADTACKLIDAEESAEQLRADYADLEQRYKDLESRPLPVQVVEKIPEQYVDFSAYEQLVNQTNEERDRMDAEFLALKRQLNTAEQQLEEARSKPPEKVTDQTAVYNALMDTAADALDRLLEFVEHNDDKFGGLYDTFINAHRRTANEAL